MQGNGAMITLLVYGYPQPEFEGKRPDEVALYLSSWGVNAVMWGGMPYKEPERAAEVNRLIDALHALGIRSFAEGSLFLGWEIPGSRPMLADGTLLSVKGGWYQGANPSVPEVRRAALDRVARILQLHPGVDGYWLDFIRWPIHWEVPDWELEGGKRPVMYETSFDADTVARFAAATGVPVPERMLTAAEKAEWIRTHAHNEWTEWKVDLITTFAREVGGMVKENRADRLLGAFTVPWREEEYEGAIRRVVGQDYRGLAQVVDVFSPMAYYEVLHRPFGFIQEFREYTAGLTGKPVWPCVMGYRVNPQGGQVGLSEDELSTLIEAAAGRQASAPGVGASQGNVLASGAILFHFRGMVDAKTAMPVRLRSPY